MNISEVTNVLSQVAPAAYQETYDNTGLLVGSGSMECTGILCTLDATEPIVEEAIRRNCNLIVAHHPIVFSGLKKLTGSNYVERTVIKALKNDVAIYAAHTNLDNMIEGVNGRIADRLGLVNRRVMVEKPGLLMKLVTFVPDAQSAKVKDALFEAGAGSIGKYSECSFNMQGTGSYRPGTGTNPFAGKVGERHHESEIRTDVIFHAHLKNKVVAALKREHPYEEVAYDLIPLANTFAEIGSGLIGELPETLDEQTFLRLVKQKFNLQAIRHTPCLHKQVTKVAVCGGAGSFLTKQAISSGADAYLTADVKYHEFFDADNQLLLADIGHFESEQFTIDLLHDVLQSKFPNFAILKSEVVTNPVQYFF